jgi:acyl carrier protein
MGSRVYQLKLISFLEEEIIVFYNKLKIMKKKKINKRCFNVIKRFAKTIEKHDKVEHWFDELDLVEILMETEKEFQILLKEQDKKIEDCVYIKDLINWLSEQVKAELYMDNRNDFMAFFRDTEKLNTLSPDDRIEIFKSILLGSSDITVELLEGLLNDYGVDDIIISLKN